MTGNLKELINGGQTEEMLTSRFKAKVGYEFPIFFFILLGVIKSLILEISGLLSYDKSSVKMSFVDHAHTGKN